MTEGMEGSSSKGRPFESILEGGDTTMKEIESEVRISKAEGEEHSNDRSKLKKVEMPVFSGNAIQTPGSSESTGTSKSIS